MLTILGDRNIKAFSGTHSVHCGEGGLSPLLSAELSRTFPKNKKIFTTESGSTAWKEMCKTKHVTENGFLKEWGVTLHTAW